MNKYIMVIDDSPTIRISVEFALKDLGYKIQHAENGMDALEKVKALVNRKEDIALCICDINMPEMDGIDFIKKFREIDRFTPVIVLTTESDDERILEGKEAGASGWIIKPFQPADLIKVVKRFLR